MNFPDIQYEKRLRRERFFLKCKFFLIGAALMALILFVFHDQIWPPPEIAEVKFYPNPSPDQVKKADLVVSGKQTGIATGKVSYREIIKSWQTPLSASAGPLATPDTPEEDSEEVVIQPTPEPKKQFWELANGKSFTIPFEGTVKTAWRDGKTGKLLGESQAELTGQTEITFGDDIIARVTTVDPLNFAVDFTPAEPPRKYWRFGPGVSFTYDDGVKPIFCIQYFRPLKLPLFGDSWGPSVIVIPDWGIAVMLQGEF